MRTIILICLIYAVYCTASLNFTTVTQKLPWMPRVRAQFHILQDPLVYTDKIIAPSGTMIFYGGWPPPGCNFHRCDDEIDPENNVYYDLWMSLDNGASWLSLPKDIFTKTYLWQYCIREDRVHERLRNWVGDTSISNVSLSAESKWQAWQALVTRSFDEWDAEYCPDSTKVYYQLRSTAESPLWVSKLLDQSKFPDLLSQFVSSPTSEHIRRRTQLKDLLAPLQVESAYGPDNSDISALWRVPIRAPRYGAVISTHYNNRHLQGANVLYVMGGAIPQIDGGNYYMTDLWASCDNGTGWLKILNTYPWSTIDSTEINLGVSPSGVMAVTFGSWTTSLEPEIWISIDGGYIWTQCPMDSKFEPNFGASLGFDTSGHMYIIGGQGWYGAEKIWKSTHSFDDPQRLMELCPDLGTRHGGPGLQSCDYR